MTSRASFLIVAAAAGALGTASIPAKAAMLLPTPPVGPNTGLTLVQDQAAGKTTKSKKSKRQQEVDRSIDSGSNVTETVP